MPNLAVGLIGFGYAGQTFHAPLIRATPALQLVAVASSNAAKVHAALGPGVEVTTADALTSRSDIDLVVIATPNDRHHPQALAALRAGRHVVVDKPFALDAAQARELVDEARRCGRLLSVFHNRRWDSDFLGLKQVLEQGLVGRPVELVSHFDRYRPQVRARWREGAGPGSGLWLDLGPHLVDQAIQLFGAPSAITLDQATLRDSAVADDYVHASLRWDCGPHAGLRVHLHASALTARPGARFTLHGTAASYTVDGLDGQEAALKAGADTAQIRCDSWGSEPRQASLWTSHDDATSARPMGLPAGAYPHYYAAVARAIHGLAEMPVTAEQALAVQQVLDAGRLSARERREVALEPFDRRC
ncbi:MAG: oxidoreductase [Burkholderiales bacterium]|nr:oxidoreductase [Burkholderiales bacterium]